MLISNLGLFIKKTSKIFKYKLMKVLLMFLIFCSQIAYSQSFYGKVIDKEANPVVGASVVNLSKGIYASTNVLGEFSIANTSAGDVLKTTIIGFYPKTDSLNKDGKIEIILTENTINLQEIVVRKVWMHSLWFQLLILKPIQ